MADDRTIIRPVTLDAEAAQVAFEALKLIQVGYGRRKAYDRACDACEAAMEPLVLVAEEIGARFAGVMDRGAYEHLRASGSADEPSGGAMAD